MASFLSGILTACLPVDGCAPKINGHLREAGLHSSSHSSGRTNGQAAANTTGNASASNTNHDNGQPEEEDLPKVRTQCGLRTANCTNRTGLDNAHLTTRTTKNQQKQTHRRQATIQYKRRDDSTQREPFNQPPIPHPPLGPSPNKTNSLCRRSRAGTTPSPPCCALLPPPPFLRPLHPPVLSSRLRPPTSSPLARLILSGHPPPKHPKSNPPTLPTLSPPLTKVLYRPTSHLPFHIRRLVVQRARDPPFFSDR